MTAQTAYCQYRDDKEQACVWRLKVADQVFCTADQILYVEVVRHDTKDCTVIELSLFQHRPQRRHQRQIIPMRLLILKITHSQAV